MLFIGLIFLSACRNESISTSWDERFQDDRYTLNAVVFTDDLNGFAVGGATWFNGVCVHTVDGGQTWQLDSLSDKEMFDIDLDRSGRLSAVGIDGYLFTKQSLDEDWVFHRLRRWDVHRGVDFYDANQGIIVSGIAFQSGVAQQFDKLLQSDIESTFEQELQAVCYSDSNTVHAVGFGQILRSTDQGVNWVPQDIRGDFFQDVCFPSAQVGYVVGRAGTILKTTNGGQDWETISNGDQLLRSNPAFRAVHFLDEQRGYVAGENGLLWKTENGGQDWIEYEDAPDIDFLDIAITSDNGFVVGEFATIFRFDP